MLCSFDICPSSLFIHLTSLVNAILTKEQPIDRTNLMSMRLIVYEIQLGPFNSKFQGQKEIKWFEMTGVRINEVKIGSKALKGK